MAYLAGGMTFLYGSTMTLSCGYDISYFQVEKKTYKCYNTLKFKTASRTF